MNFNIINNFFLYLKKRKSYTKVLNEIITKVCKIKNKKYQKLSLNLFKQKNLFQQKFLITYIIDILFARKNIWLHIRHFLGNSKYFCSGSSFSAKKAEKKKVKILSFKLIFYFLLKDMRYLSNSPLGLHLQKVTLSNFWILKKFKTNFLIQVVKHFNLFCYNGCRKRKVRRKKIKIKKKWPRGLKQRIVNS